MFRVPKTDNSGNALISKRGYSFNDTIINPINAEAVKIMFNMALEGYKRCDIIDRLHELGYRNSDGEEFIGTYIDRVLRNERYAGTYVYTIK